MLDRPQYRDVVVAWILPNLNNSELVALYNTSKSMRDRVITFKNWKRKYHSTFPHDTQMVCDNPFEQYIRRCNASVHLFEHGKQLDLRLPADVIVVNLVASRFLVAALCVSGDVYIGPNWTQVPGLRATQLWAGIDHLYALADGCIWMWKFFDLMPTQIEHIDMSISGATCCCSGANVHAAFIPGTGVVWWKHTVESIIEPQILSCYEDGVIDMLVMKNGLLVLCRDELHYWHEMATQTCIDLPARDVCKLRRIDFHKGIFAAVTTGGALFNVNLCQTAGFGRLVDLALSYVLGFWTHRQQHSQDPRQLKAVDCVDTYAALIVGELDSY